MKRVSDEFKRQLKEQIAKVEEQTSVEFVPVLAEASSSYHTFKLGLLMIGAIICDAFYNYLHLPMPELVAICGAIFVALLACFISPQVLYYVLPRRMALHKVERAAGFQFLRHEIFATRARTGVLIYVSQLERAVFVLADKGLLKKFDGKYWQNLGVKLAHDFTANDPGRSFTAALEAMAADLAREFPPGDDNPNELPDDLL